MAVMNTLTDLALRPYQVDALDRIGKAAARGVRRQLGVAATGLGKTIIFCALAREMGVRTLIIAHRDELIEQAAANVRKWWPDADVGIVKGDRDEVHARVVIASVQTLSRPARLARLLAPTLLGEVPFGLMVIDEAHHAAAESYRKLMHGLRCNEPDGPLLLGVTATPDRGDGKGLSDLFDEITFNNDIRWGIAQDYLCDLRGLRVKIDADLRGLKVTAGDYNQGQAGQMLEDGDAPALIVKAWLAHANGRRTLVFTPTVALAEAVRDEFLEAGVRSASVDGEMPIDERRATLAAYSRGDIDVIANCAVLTEGYDEPRTDCIVVARPTKSRALYTQMIGRGTRKHPDKGNCLVIDVVGATEMHDLVTVPSLFGIEQPGKVWDSERTVTDVLREQIERQAVEGRLKATEAELFKKVRAAGRMAWVACFKPGEQRRYELGLMSQGEVVMVELPDETWRVGHRAKDGTKTVLMDRVEMELAQGVGEDFARKRGVGAQAAQDAPWRDKRASAKQREAAKRFRIELPAGCTKGQASDLLGAHLGRLKAKKRASVSRETSVSG